MKKLFLVVAVVGMLLLAGCIQAPEKGGEKKAEKAGTQGEQKQKQVEEKRQEQEGEQQKYEEMTMGALMNLGVPIKCTFTYSSPQHGVSGTGVYYILKRNIRMENQHTGRERTFSSTVIIKNEGAYILTSEEMKTGPYQSCDWLFFPAGAEEAKGFEIDENEKVSKRYEGFAHEYTYKCEPGIFGEEKFVTPGKVCNIKEMMMNIYANIPDSMQGQNASGQ